MRYVVALLVVLTFHSSSQVSSLTVVIVFIIPRLVRERLRKFIVIFCVTYPKRYSIREVWGSRPIPGLVTSAAYTTKSALLFVVQVLIRSLLAEIDSKLDNFIQNRPKRFKTLNNPANEGRYTIKFSDRIPVRAVRVKQRVSEIDRLVVRAANSKPINKENLNNVKLKAINQQQKHQEHQQNTEPATPTLQAAIAKAAEKRRAYKQQSNEEHI
ncbi:hypothetical protein LXL04_028660 [Taraxacum kok-saghyz]